MSTTLRRSLARALILVGAVAGSTALAHPAEAMSHQARDRVVHVAASKAGTPYVYGADGPRAFDCSGYTKWVFSKMGRHLPRTASAQSGGHVYHVAIYAGHNSVWHSPRPGQRVKREHLWTSAVSYGRVR